MHVKACTTIQRMLPIKDNKYYQIVESWLERIETVKNYIFIFFLTESKKLGKQLECSLVVILLCRYNNALPKKGNQNIFFQGSKNSYVEILYFILRGLQSMCIYLGFRCCVAKYIMLFMLNMAYCRSIVEMSLCGCFFMWLCHGMQCQMRYGIL